MSKIKPFALSIALMIILIACYGLFDKLKDKKEVYIFNSEVYDNFELKKELEMKIIEVQNARKLILDSLELRVQLRFDVLKKKNILEKERSDYELIRQEYLYKKKQFEEENTALANQYTTQIWTHLNQYIKEFGESHNYDMIYGSDGTGNIMYAREKYNITKDVIEYVNKKYKGDEK